MQSQVDSDPELRALAAELRAARTEADREATMRWALAVRCIGRAHAMTSDTVTTVIRAARDGQDVSDELREQIKDVDRALMLAREVYALPTEEVRETIEAFLQRLPDPNHGG